MNLMKLNNLKGCRNSKNRNAVIEILDFDSEPVTADYIYQKLKEINPSVSISTVYRSLEKLTTNNIIIKSIIMDSSKATYELNRETHKHYLICIRCNKMTPLENCPFKDYEKKLQKDTRFNITGHKFEIYGKCFECNKS